MKNARETMIRDIFAVYDEIAQKYIGDNLGRSIEITRVKKEYELPSGRVDLLFIGTDDVLYLVELKVEKANNPHVSQVRRYYDDIVNKQDQEELPGESVQLVLLAPMAEQLEVLGEPPVKLIDLDIETVLYKYLTQSSAYKEFQTLKPNILRGGASILNLKKFVTHLVEKGGIVQYSDLLEELRSFAPRGGRSKGSLDGLVERGRDFDLLVKRKDGNIILTSRGYQFHDLSPIDQEYELKKSLREYIYNNPIHTPTIHGLCLLVESVYEVLLYHHPAERQDVKNTFIRKSMKVDAWKQTTQDRVYNEYAALAEELLLVHRVGDKVELTPYGLELVGALQSTRTTKIYHSLYKLEEK